jgi:AcrR family transcriptional regulator
VTPAARPLAQAGGRAAQKAATRERVLAAAARLFATRGFAATRTADVARAARVSHGAVFVHFPTRESLVEESIEAFGRSIMLRTHELASQGRGLRDVLQAHLAGLREHEAYYSRLIAEEHVLPPAARNTLIGTQSALSTHVAEAAARDAGRLRELPLDLLFNTWIALLHYYLAHRDLFAPGGSVLERRGQELLDHMMTLVTSQDAGPVKAPARPVSKRSRTGGS